MPSHLYMDTCNHGSNATGKMVGHAAGIRESLVNPDVLYLIMLNAHRQHNCNVFSFYEGYLPVSV